MLLAPIALNEPRKCAAQQRSARAAAASPSRAHELLSVWLAVGALAWLLVPALRGGPLLGHTAAFWLVGAPLLDLVWLRRLSIGRRIVALAGTRGQRRRGAVRLPRRITSRRP